MTLADKELIGGCLEGDETAREEFVRRFSRLVYNCIQGTFKSKSARIGLQDVEDLHNSVFLSFFDRRCRKLRQYEGRNGCSLASWVRMVTVRCVLDHLRRGSDPLERPEKPISLELTEEPAAGEQASPLSRMMEKERQVLVQQAMQRLSSRDRLMLQLHCIEERPLAQVALILGISEDNSHSVKHRAIRRLRETAAELMKDGAGPARKSSDRRPLDMN
jgi:RNA polymerase sigma-70 factor, ECF subfamily